MVHSIYPNTGRFEIVCIVCISIQITATNSCVSFLFIYFFLSTPFFFCMCVCVCSQTVVPLHIHTQPERLTYWIDIGRTRAMPLRCNWPTDPAGWLTWTNSTYTIIIAIVLELPVWPAIVQPDTRIIITITFTQMPSAEVQLAIQRL